MESIDDATQVLTQTALLELLLQRRLFERVQWLREQLKSRPPTKELLNVVRLDGQVIFHSSPPSAAEWNAYVSSMPQGQLVSVESGCRELTLILNNLKLSAAPLQASMKKRRQLLAQLEDRVNAFIKHEKTPSSENTLTPHERKLRKVALVEHAKLMRAAAASGAAATQTAADVFRALLRNDDARFESFDQFVMNAAKTLSARLNVHKAEFEYYKASMQDYPWRLKPFGVYRSLNEFKQEMALFEQQIHALASSLKQRAEVVHESEYRLHAVKCAHKMQRLDAQIERAQEAELEQLFQERAQLQVNVIEPMLSLRERSPGTELNADTKEAKMARLEQLWREFYNAGTLHDINKLEREQKQARGQLQRQQARAAQIVGNGQMHHFLLAALMSFEQNIRVAFEAAAKLPASMQPPDNEETASPQQLLSAFENVVADHGVGDAFGAGAANDAFAHFTNWYAASQIDARREQLEERRKRLQILVAEALHAAPKKLQPRSLRPLPSLFDAAKALAIVAR